VLNIVDGQFCSAPNPVSARSSPTLPYFIKFTATQKRENKMWQAGEVIAWRGIYKNRPWHVQSAIVIKDAHDEIIVCFLPGAESMAEKDYARGNKKNGKRRWDFKNNDWELASYSWHTNRVLAITEPDQYYSIMLFWKE
jgi:hypothetical protein